MTKKKKLVKSALKHPELFSQGELAYMLMWLEERKRVKCSKKTAQGFKKPNQKEDRSGPK